MPVARPLPPQDELLELLSYDPLSGKLMWKFRPVGPATWNGKWAGKIAGGVSKSNGHMVLNIGRRLMLVHRVIWKMVYGVDPPHDLDHRDGDPTNNRQTNLRSATHFQNMRNKKPHRGKALPKGVSWSKAGNRYRASIFINNKQRHLGLFDDPSDAHSAYCAAATKAFGEFARFG